MSSINFNAVASKSNGILGVVISLPRVFIRRVARIPAALVDMMEKHGSEK